MWYRLSEYAINHFHEGKQFNPDMFKDFVRANKFNMATFSSPIDYAKLLKDGRFPKSYSCLEWNSPPYIDHARIFKSTKTGVMCLTYQPYKEAVENRFNIEQWANDNGLKAEIHGSECSWYYPGETLLIVVHLRDIEISLK